MNTHKRMSELIEAAIPQEGDWVPKIVAEKFVAELAEKEPALLNAWLHDHAAVFVADLMGKRDRDARTLARNQARRGAFRGAAEAFGLGQEDAFTGLFDTYLVVNNENVRRAVRDMTGADHRHVADDYMRSGRFDLLLAEFHRSVAKKVGKNRTGEVLTEEQYARLYRSIVERGDAA